MLSLSRSWIGVVVSIAGNVTISLALNCQKLAHTRLQQHHHNHQQQQSQQDQLRDDDGPSDPASADDADHRQHPQPQKQNGHAGTPSSSTSHSSGNGSGSGMDTEFLHSKLWWLGLALMTLGEAGNFISYGFAPASLVAPLGAVALLSNVIISPILLKERFKPSDIGGIFLAIVGAVTVVFSSKQNDTRLDPDQLLARIERPDFVICTVSFVFLGSLLAFLSTTSLGDRFVLIDVGACAIFGGYTVLSTKGISSLISGGQPIEALKFPITYGLIVVLAVTAVIQITYLNRALQRFDSREVIPTQFVFFTISAIVGSAILYRDFENMDAHRLINFLFGCLTTFAGVFVLTWRHKGETSGAQHGQGGDETVEEDEDDDGEEEQQAEGAEGQGEQEALLSKSWHGPERAERGRYDTIGKSKGRTSLNFLEPAFEEAHSDALRVPSSSSGKRNASSASTSSARPRSRTNSPHKASRLSNSYERSSLLSRSASNQPTGGLSTSNSAAGGVQRTPKLGLMSMDRPTGLSPGHYLLMATPPPSFTLNPVAPVSSSAGAAGRSGVGRGLARDYGAISGSGAPRGLPFPVTMTPATKRTRADSSQQQQQQQQQQQGEPSAAETIVSPQAETTTTSVSGQDLESRLSEQMSPTRQRSRAGSGTSTPRRP